jgi:hypothetical protein
LQLKTFMIYSVAFCFTIFFCFPVFPHGTQCSSSLFFSSECSLFFVTQNLLIQYLMKKASLLLHHFVHLSISSSFIYLVSV